MDAETALRIRVFLTKGEVERFWLGWAAGDAALTESVHEVIAALAKAQTVMNLPKCEGTE